MKHSNFKLLPVAVLAVALVAACGGGGGAPAAPPVGGAPGTGDAAVDVANSVAAVVNYTDRLIATDENGDPVDINGLTLASDETSEAAPVVF